MMIKMPDKQPFLFFDTVVLSNFAFADGGIVLLKKKYHKRGMLTLQVIEEIRKATFIDYDELENLDERLMARGSFQKIFLNDKEQSQYLTLLRNLGSGEASCIAAATQRNGIVVTDDRMARNCCKENHVSVTGTIGILKAVHQEGLINIDKANRMLKQMIKKGFYSPVSNISDVL